MIRLTVSRPVRLGVKFPSGTQDQIFITVRQLGVCWYGVPHPGERTGLSFIIAAGPRQRSHSRVRVPRDSWPHFTVSHSRLPQSGGPVPRIYIPQEEGGPVIPPRHCAPYSSPPTIRRATLEVFEPTFTWYGLDGRGFILGRSKLFFYSTV
jgi:hypothetical protein